MPATLKPGVVTGQDYITLINAAKDGGYALPAVNIVDSGSANAALEAAAKAKSDIIIQVSNGGAQFFAGKGLKDTFQAKVLGAQSFAQHVNLMAQAYGVCAVLHTDHADKKHIPWVESMIGFSRKNFEQTGKPLFSSHMLDLSAEPLDYNIEQSARILQQLNAVGMSLEIELGVTGGEEDGIDNSHAENSKLYTQPEEVWKAYNALKDIGHVTIAAAFGNTHGVYKPGNVKLRPEILDNTQKFIRQQLGTADQKPLSFVFHGGSGSDRKDIEAAVSYGVVKMNIDTDTQFARSKPVGAYVEANPVAFKHQIDPGNPDIVYKDKYDPRKWLRKSEEGVVERLQQAFEELGSTGKSLAAPAPGL